MELKYEAVGTIDLSKGFVDITDPCYNRSVWCRMNQVKVKPGEYNSYIKRDTNSERVAMAGIRLGLDDGNYTVSKLGSIGVDAGLAGFWPNKPDYDTDEEWQHVCEEYLFTPNDDKDYYEFDNGFCSSSGWGDGMYPVYACKDSNGEIVALEIHFMED